MFNCEKCWDNPCTCHKTEGHVGFNFDDDNCSTIKLTGVLFGSSEIETKKPIELINNRLKKLEDIIYNNKLYVKCPLCNGTGKEDLIEGEYISCAYCNNGYLEVKIKDDSK